nr:hypothetical protein [Tanacetum cinerariifolium]
MVATGAWPESGKIKGWRRLGGSGWSSDEWRWCSGGAGCRRAAAVEMVTGGSKGHLLGEMKIHGYDGPMLKRRSDGLFHDHFGVDRSREVGMIWSFSVLGVCKRTKIPFVCEYGLTSERDSEHLTELLERESDEFVLNHKGDKNDARVISLKSDLTIKV